MSAAFCSGHFRRIGGNGYASDMAWFLVEYPLLGRKTGFRCRGFLMLRLRATSMTRYSPTNFDAISVIASQVQNYPHGQE